MVETILYGYNLFCHMNNLKDNFTRPKYPPDVAQLCYYFESQKAELPDYCKWQDSIQPPRRRSEF